MCAKKNLLLTAASLGNTYLKLKRYIIIIIIIITQTHYVIIRRTQDQKQLCMAIVVAYRNKRFCTILLS